jgi:hypothetical protein
MFTMDDAERDYLRSLGYTDEEINTGQRAQPGMPEPPPNFFDEAAAYGGNEMVGYSRYLGNLTAQERDKGQYVHPEQWRFLSSQQKAMYAYGVDSSQFPQEYGRPVLPEGYIPLKGERAMPTEMALGATYMARTDAGETIFAAKEGKEYKRFLGGRGHERVELTGLSAPERGWIKAGPESLEPETFQRARAAYIVGGTPGVQYASHSPSVGDMVSHRVAYYEQQAGKPLNLAPVGTRWDAGQDIVPFEGADAFRDPLRSYEVESHIPRMVEDENGEMMQAGTYVRYKRTQPGTLIRDKSLGVKWGSAPNSLVDQITDLEGNNLGIQFLGDQPKDIQGVAYAHFLSRGEGYTREKLGLGPNEPIPQSYAQLGEKALAAYKNIVPDLVKTILVPEVVHESRLGDLQGRIHGAPVPVENAPGFYRVQMPYQAIVDDTVMVASEDFAPKKGFITYEDLQDIRRTSPEMYQGIMNLSQRGRETYGELMNAATATAEGALMPGAKTLTAAQARSFAAQATEQARERLGLGAQDVVPLGQTARELLPLMEKAGLGPMAFERPGGNSVVTMSPRGLGRFSSGDVYGAETSQYTSSVAGAVMALAGGDQEAYMASLARLETEQQELAGSQEVMRRMLGAELPNAVGGRITGSNALATNQYMTEVYVPGQGTGAMQVWSNPGQGERTWNSVFYNIGDEEAARRQMNTDQGQIFMPEEAIQAFARDTDSDIANAMLLGGVTERDGALFDPYGRPMTNAEQIKAYAAQSIREGAGDIRGEYAPAMTREEAVARVQESLTMGQGLRALTPAQAEAAFKEQAELYNRIAPAYQNMRTMMASAAGQGADVEAAARALFLGTYNVAQRPAALGPGEQQFQDLMNLNLNSSGLYQRAAGKGGRTTFKGLGGAMYDDLRSALETETMSPEQLAAVMGPEGSRGAIAQMIEEYRSGQGTRAARLGRAGAQYEAALGENAPQTWATQSVRGRAIISNALNRMDDKLAAGQITQADYDKGMGNLGMSAEQVAELRGVIQRSQDVKSVMSHGRGEPRNAEELRDALDAVRRLDAAQGAGLSLSPQDTELLKGFASDLYGQLGDVLPGANELVAKPGELTREAEQYASPIGPEPADYGSPIGPVPGGNGNQPPVEPPVAVAAPEPESNGRGLTFRDILKRHGGTDAFKLSMRDVVEKGAPNVPGRASRAILNDVLQNAPDELQAYEGFLARFGISLDAGDEGVLYHNYSRLRGQKPATSPLHGGEPAAGGNGNPDLLAQIAQAVAGGQEGDIRAFMKINPAAGTASVNIAPPNPSEPGGKMEVVDRALGRMLNGESLDEESLIGSFEARFGDKAARAYGDVRAAQSVFAGGEVTKEGYKAALNVAAQYSQNVQQFEKAGGTDVAVQMGKEQSAWMNQQIARAGQTLAGQDAEKLAEAQRKATEQLEDVTTRMAEVGKYSKDFGEAMQKTAKTLGEVDEFLGGEFKGTATQKARKIDELQGELGQREKRLGSYLQDFEPYAASIEKAGLKSEVVDQVREAQAQRRDIRRRQGQLGEAEYENAEEMGQQVARRGQNYMALMTLSYLPWQLQFAQQWGGQAAQEQMAYTAKTDEGLSQAMFAMGGTAQSVALQQTRERALNQSWSQYYMGQGAALGSTANPADQFFAGNPAWARGVGAAEGVGPLFGYGLAAEMVSSQLLPRLTGGQFNSAFIGPDSLLATPLGQTAAGIAAPVAGFGIGVSVANAAQQTDRTWGQRGREIWRTFLQAGASGGYALQGALGRTDAAAANAQYYTNPENEGSPFYLGQFSWERQDAQAKAEQSQANDLMTAFQKAGFGPDEATRYAEAYARSGLKDTSQIVQEASRARELERLAGLQPGALAGMAGNLTRGLVAQGGLQLNAQATSQVADWLDQVAQTDSSQFAASYMGFQQSMDQWGQWGEKMGLDETQRVSLGIGTARMSQYQRQRVIEQATLSTPRAWSEAMLATKGRSPMQGGDLSDLSLLDEDMLHPANWDEQRSLELAQRRWNVSNTQYQLGQETTQLAYQRSWMQQGNALEDTLTGLRNTYRVEDADMGIQRLQASLQQAQQSQQLQAQQNQLAQAQFNWRREDIATSGYRADVQLGWQLQDIGESREKFNLQLGWQMDDYDKAIRYATGRQRIQLKEQKERAVQMAAYQEADFSKDEARTLTQHEWGDEDRAKQLERLNAEEKLRQEALKVEEESQKKNLELMKQQLEIEEKRRDDLVKIVIPTEQKQEELRREQAEKQLQWSEEKLARDKKYYAEILPLQAAYNTATDRMQEAWTKYQTTLEVGLPKAMELAAKTTEAAWTEALKGIQAELEKLMSDAGSDDTGGAFANAVKKVVRAELARTYRDAGASAGY